MSETEIISRLREGNEKAFSELVELYRQMVVNTCFGLLHNTEDAEDVAQDVFIEVFRSVDKFRADAKLSTWLYRIAVNRSLNFIRNNKRRKWFLSFDDLTGSKKRLDEHPLIGDMESPDFNLENSQRSRMLHKTIDSLPEKQRVAFTLNKYEDLSYKEISEIMNLSVPSVESLIHRAKKSLQKKLYHWYQNRSI